MKRIILTLLLALAALTATSRAQPRGERVLIFDIKEEIGSTAWVHTSEALRRARETGADHIILHMNTYGGEVTFADSIRTAILSCPTPVYAFIDVNAASAGALIATACDSIFMSPGSSIGAASVVSGADGAKMPDKYQSYMRGIMRSTAEAHPWRGADTTRLYLRDPRVAEAFVDEAVSIDGIIDSSHVLTLTANEAMKLNYCEGMMRSVDEVAVHVAGPRPVVDRYTPTVYDNIKGGLLSTWLRGILILFIVGGIYFEIQSPGVGVALFVAIGAAILYFAPLYIDGLAANWEIILFLIGVALIVAEVFFIPGFGVAGVAGFACLAAGLVLSLVGNDGLSFSEVPTDHIAAALWTVSLSIIVSVGLCIFLACKLIKGGKSGPWSILALKTTQQAEEGYVGVEKETLESLVRSQGVATTDLRPGGKVKIGATVYDAISDGTYIERGSGVVVTSVSSGQVVVSRKE